MQGHRRPETAQHVLPDRFIFSTVWDPWLVASAQQNWFITGDGFIASAQLPERYQQSAQSVENWRRLHLWVCWLLSIEKWEAQGRETFQKVSAEFLKLFLAFVSLDQQASLEKAL